MAPSMPVQSFGAPGPPGRLSTSNPQPCPARLLHLPGFPSCPSLKGSFLFSCLLMPLLTLHPGSASLLLKGILSSDLMLPN